LDRTALVNDSATHRQRLPLWHRLSKDQTSPFHPDHGTDEAVNRQGAIDRIWLLKGWYANRNPTAGQRNPIKLRISHWLLVYGKVQPVKHALKSACTLVKNFAQQAI
jgi:hypothetical protein